MFHNGVVALMGPTASGKTDIAVALAQQFPIDLISVDSALVYRGMTIGTAKPDAAVLAKAPHRLIDICDPTQAYSAGQFCVDAKLALAEIQAQHRIPLLVGGTMLYFRSLFFGIAELPKGDPVLRATLDAECREKGLTALYEQLKKVDPEAAATIKPQDTQRIQRALEVFLMTGEKLSVLQKEKAVSPLLSSVISIGLMPQDRSWLHERIAKRFDEMLKKGFLEEMQALRARGDLTKEMPSMRVVGYRQAWEYLDGQCDFETMRNNAIVATRQLAKRQMTWLRSFPNVHLFDPQDPQLEKNIEILVDKSKCS